MKASIMVDDESDGDGDGGGENKRMWLLKKRREYQERKEYL